MSVRWPEKAVTAHNMKMNVMQLKSMEEKKKKSKMVGKQSKIHKYILAICDELAIRGLQYELEYKFHPHRKWRFDIYVPSLKVGIEYNGGQYTNGAHLRGTHYASDLDKANAAQVLGFKILQFTTSHMTDLGARGIVNIIKSIQ